MNIILAYHNVSPGIQGRPHTRTQCSLDVFREHMETLSRMAPVGSVWDLIVGRVQIALSFDDGYAGCRDASEILRKYGLRATFFVVGGWVGRTGYLSWHDLWELKEQGMEIGFHTDTHANLSSCCPRWKNEEIVLAKHAFEERLGDRVRGFCYPFGIYDDLCLDLVEKAGYRYAVTTVTGYNDHYSHPLTLQRVGIRGDHSLEELTALVQPIVGTHNTYST